MATIERRTSAKGTSYRVKIRLTGKPPVSRTFSRHHAAKAWASATEATLRDGTHATGSGHTVTEAINGFLAAKLASKKDQRMLAARASWWRAEVGGIKLRDLAASHIERGLASLAASALLTRKPFGPSKPRSGATINRYRAAISAVLTWAHKQSPPWV
jgi:hypothetical protein